MLISINSASSPIPWRSSRPSSGCGVVCGSRLPQLTQINRGGRSLVLATSRAPQEGQAKKLASANHPRLPAVGTSDVLLREVMVQGSAGLAWESCTVEGRAN
jgi:hypothetical protein